MSRQRVQFELERKRFDDSTEFCVSVSKVYSGREANIPIRMASYVLTRTCVCADSLRYILRRDLEASRETTLDHYSAGVLARNIIEGCLMFLYLMEDGVSDQEWSLRGKVLHLHDATLKLRLFKSISAEGQYKAFKEIVAELRQSIKSAPAYASLDVARQERILTGQEMYLRGLRGMYAYLSSQVHISPTSFFETHKRLGFGEIADYQYYFAAYALAHTRMLLARAALRLAESVPELALKFNVDTLQSIKELSGIPFGE
jgi:hypothetical protein